MRPRNKHEEAMVAINDTLREEISTESMEWAKSHSYKDDKDKSIYYYFHTEEDIQGVNVKRLYRIYRMSNRRNKINPFNYYFMEVVRNIGGSIFSKSRQTMGTYCFDSFCYGTDIVLRSDRPNWCGYTLKELFTLSELCPVVGNEKVDCIWINPKEINGKINSTPYMETLYKTKPYIFYNIYCYADVKTISNSVRIALKHHYDLNRDNIRTWVDMVDMLRKTHHDINNPFFICPQNLQFAHQQAFNRLQRQTERERGARQIEEANLRKEDNERYIKAKQKYFDLVISNGHIECRVLRSVLEFAQEGDYMHHCVYACGYYRKPTSLIFSARIDGVRIETIEVDLNRMKVVQCYGKYDKKTEYHEEILELFKKNMYQIENLKAA